MMKHLAKRIEFIKCMRSAGVEIEILIEYRNLFEQGKSTVEARKRLLEEQRDTIDYEHMTVSLRPGMKIERDAMLKKLINMQYSRNELDFKRGTF